MNTGDIIKPSSTGLNDLFTTIESMRAKHLTASQQAGSNTSGITSAFDTAVARTGNLAARTNVQRIQDNLTAIAGSGSFVENNSSSRYTTTITVPAVGALITAANFNSWQTVVNNMNNVCGRYSRYSGQYGSRYGHYGHYGEYGHYGAYDHYLWYTQKYTKRSAWRGK